MAIEKLDTGMIHMVLRYMGIRELSVEFDCEKKAIRAIYVQHGHHKARTIPFADIEQLLDQKANKDPRRAPARPPGDAPVE